VSLGQNKLPVLPRQPIEDPVLEEPLRRRNGGNTAERCAAIVNGVVSFGQAVLLFEGAQPIGELL
jgi:hypothetical protein